MPDWRFEISSQWTAVVLAVYCRGMEPIATDTLTRKDIAGHLLDSPANAIVACDREGTIVFWNAGAERVFGFTQAEAAGKSLDLIIPPPFRERHWQGYHATVRTGVSRYGAGDMLAVPGLHKDGRRISVEFTITLVKDADDRIAGMVAVMSDVTRRFEELKRLRKSQANKD